MATAAIKGWSLLLTTVPAWRMTAHSVEQSLQVTLVMNVPFVERQMSSYDPEEAKEKKADVKLRPRRGKSQKGLHCLVDDTAKFSVWRS